MKWLGEVVHSSVVQCHYYVDQITGIQSMLNGAILPLKTQNCNLGIILDSSLNLDVHVSMVIRSTSAQLKIVHHVTWLWQHFLITSHLDY